MSAAALLSILYILGVFLVVESCTRLPAHHTTHGFPYENSRGDKDKGKDKGNGGGVVPPHPFRKRSVVDDDAAAAADVEFDQFIKATDMDFMFANLKDIVTQQIQGLFDDLDKNQDKFITVTEWVRRKAGISEYSRILRTFDTNEDDALSFDEFLAASTYSLNPNRCNKKILY